MFTDFKLLFRSPLSQKLIKGLFVFGVSAVVVVSLLQFISAYKLEKDALLKQLENVQKYNLAAIIESTWSTNQKETLLQLEGIVANNYIDHAFIHDGSKIWVTAGTTTKNNSIQQTYPLSYFQGQQRYDLGTLTINANLDRVWKIAVDHTLDLLFSNIIIMLLIGGFIFIFLNQLITRHLIDAAKYVNALSPGQLTTPLQLQRNISAAQDELDYLAIAINDMHLNTDKLMKSISESEELIRQLIDASETPIYLFDQDGKCLMVNQHFCNLFNKEREELIGLHRSEIMPAEIALQHRNNDIKVLESGEKLSIEESSFEFDGWHHYISNKFPVQNAIGEIYAIGGISTDITDRKRTEQALYDSQTMLAAIHDAQVSFIANPDTQTTFDNLMKNLLKVTDSEFGFIGQIKYTTENQPFLKILVMTGIKWSNDTSQLYKNYTENGMEFHNLKNIFGEVILNQKPVISNDIKTDPRSGGLPSGHPSMQNFFGMPFFHGDKLTGMIGIANKPNGYEVDLCQRIQPFLSTCASIIVANETEYQRASIEQERERLQNQLLQSQKMESIGHLTGGIAHDFNNMLGVILGYTELLKQTNSNPTPEISMVNNKYINEILMAGNRAKQLIAQMLMFSRLSPDLNSKDTPATLVQPVIKEVTNLLRASIPSTVEVNYKPTNENFIALIQPVHLHQILLNLGINARDAVGDYGQISIALSRHKISNKCNSCHEYINGDYIDLEVSDNGKGINAEFIDKIFDPFFTTKEIGKGTGMGLSVVHGIVHSLGGHISVTSQRDKGTSFHIYLPAVTRETDTITGNTSSESNESILTTLNGLRIMVIDDEKSIANMLKEMLSMNGAHVTVFESPLQAIHVFEQNPLAYDLVITDETMPGLSGLSLSRKMLQLNSDLSILLCTGYSDSVDENVALQAGIKGFMSKPVKFSQLNEWILSRFQITSQENKQ